MVGRGSETTVTRDPTTDCPDQKDFEGATNTTDK